MYTSYLSINRIQDLNYFPQGSFNNLKKVGAYIKYCPVQNKFRSVQNDFGLDQKFLINTEVSQKLNINFDQPTNKSHSR